MNYRSQNQSKTGLFPLGSMVLPGGRMKLRIFEPRYLRMVKDAVSTGTGFVHCILNSKGNKEDNSHIFPIGTHVKVVDFDSLEGGMLGITIEGVSLVKIDGIETQFDQLRVGNMQIMDGWSMNSDVKPPSVLVSKLKEVFDAYPEVGELYPEKKMDCMSWVCMRWLELLPLDVPTKLELLKAEQPEEVTLFIHKLFEEEKN